MEKDDMFEFLVKTAIPEKTHKKGEEPKKYPRIWDAIWRAHRDTLTGRYKLTDYIAAEGENKHNVTKALYNKIENCVDRKESISSESLISYLSEQPQKVEFGAIQKLVNMTLKYLIILKSFDLLVSKDLVPIDLDIDESKCHCPLDSIILEKLGHTELRWTSVSKDKYNDVQDEISKRLSSEEKPKGNIFYDFKYW